MKLKIRLICAFMLVLSGTSLTANAEFFSDPLDWWDNNDDYDRYNYQDRRGYGRDRWRQYDEWEPNYWRYRFFDNDSNDRFYDRFDGNNSGYGRNDFNFDMNMGFDGDSRYDGDYDNDYRLQNDRRGYSNRYPADRSNRDYDRRPAPREYGEPRYQNEDQYNDEYWRNYSRRYGSGNNRGGSDMYERGPRR
jgi:hypothetical protein